MDLGPHEVANLEHHQIYLTFLLDGELALLWSQACLARIYQKIN
jgi:hypothetical protein